MWNAYRTMGLFPPPPMPGLPPMPELPPFPPGSGGPPIPPAPAVPGFPPIPLPGFPHLPLPPFPLPPVPPLPGFPPPLPPLPGFPPPAPAPAPPPTPPPAAPPLIVPQPYPVYETTTPQAPTAGVPLDQASRLLEMAQRSVRAVNDAVQRGSSAGAAETDRSAAAVARGCLDDLTKAMGDREGVLAELTVAQRDRRPARVNAAQIAALETFAVCAGKVGGARGAEAPAAASGALTGLVGVGLGLGLPAVAAALMG